MAKVLTPREPGEGASLKASEDAEARFASDGYVIERPSDRGELPSFFVDSEIGPAWTWDKPQATVFKDKDEASKLVADKTEKSPAGAAAGEGAKVVKATN